MNPELLAGLLKGVQKYGLPTVIACLLGYIMIAELRADQKEIKSQQGALVVEQQNLGRGILKLADKSGETQMLQEKILMVLRAMCVQDATTPADRRACLKE